MSLEYLDRKAYPWKDDPRVSFTDAEAFAVYCKPGHVFFAARENGVLCVVQKGPGAVNGYIAIPPSHPWHGKGYDDIQDFVNVHGGLTYAGKVHHLVKASILKKDERDWWLFGWDYAHYLDQTYFHSEREGDDRIIMPGYNRFGLGGELPHLWTAPEVEAHVLAASKDFALARRWDVRLRRLAARLWNAVRSAW